MLLHYRGEIGKENKTGKNDTDPDTDGTIKQIPTVDLNISGSRR